MVGGDIVAGVDAVVDALVADEDDADVERDETAIDDVDAPIGKPGLLRPLVLLTETTGIDDESCACVPLPLLLDDDEPWQRQIIASSSASTGGVSKLVLTFHQLRREVGASCERARER